MKFKLRWLKFNHVQSNVEGLNSSIWSTTLSPRQEKILLLRMNKSRHNAWSNLAALQLIEKKNNNKK